MSTQTQGRSVKLQITLSETAMKKLTQLCEQKGVKRSSIIAMAIDIFYGEEASRNKVKNK